MSYDVFFYVLMFVKRLLNGKMFWRGEDFLKLMVKRIKLIFFSKVFYKLVFRWCWNLMLFYLSWWGLIDIKIS